MITMLTDHLLNGMILQVNPPLPVAISEGTYAKSSPSLISDAYTAMPSTLGPDVASGGDCVAGHVSHDKKNRILSIESWLFTDGTLISWFMKYTRT